YGYKSQITYTRSANGGATWMSSDGRSGTIEPNKFHTQPYFPLWSTSDKLTFTGRLLPDNGYLLPTGAFTQQSFEFGYADNQPNSSERSIINLAWAVDSEGNSVELPSIHFIKIYTGVFQESAELGECSTEICGIEIPSE
ncbi:MAG: PKD domain-containing protein, partial [Muribaculaceae bacterium]|nr:PKD domain-containing protein [Muribaculaceae bacterium]